MAECNEKGITDEGKKHSLEKACQNIKEELDLAKQDKDILESLNGTQGSEVLLLILGDRREKKKELLVEKTSKKNELEEKALNLEKEFEGLLKSKEENQKDPNLKEKTELANKEKEERKALAGKILELQQEIQGAAKTREDGKLMLSNMFPK